MKDFLHFSDRLRERMASQGLNASQLAQAIEVSHVAVGNFLKGQLPKSEHLHRLAAVLGCSMEWLLTGGGPSAAPAISAKGEDWRARAMAAEAELKRLKARLRELTAES